MKSPKTILITGATSGIGYALAAAYAAEGITLLLSGRNTAKLREIEERCKAKGARVIPKMLDVTDAGGMAAWIAAEDVRNPIDLVIANAGISAGTGGKDMMSGENESQSKLLFAVNVGGVLNTVHPLIPLMEKRKRGQIAIVSSLAGFRSLPGAPSYSATKAAVRYYGEALRGALKPVGVEVSVICPGYIKTPMTDVNDYFMPFLMGADKAARIIKRRLEKNPARLAFPWPMYAVVRLMEILPFWLTEPLFDRLPKKSAVNPDNA
ncbi:MAG: SDR family NAD(P)-dependent oxidoreductase [Proteobacteria bacterium]|nr:SDR family NAD(P)-dependent oxidoreductase [Pseudomonadota bacterium]